MSTSLAVIERELTPRLPIFKALLPASVTPERLMRTVMMSIERLPKLLDCTPQSIVNAATTAAVLGLEVDGVTGQGFLIPYGDKATFQIGYKGYNTLGARAGYTINGGVVREGDEFDYMLGSDGFVKHKPLLENLNTRRIVAAWATAASRGRPAIIAVLAIEEIEAIKAKSPGAKKTDSPWRDIVRQATNEDGGLIPGVFHGGVGYSAMCEKTAKRRLARSMPLSVMTMASALEDRHDLGEAAYIDENRRIHSAQIDGPSQSPRADGPVSTGKIIDIQPEDLTSPANPPPARSVWPTFSTVKDFQAYSATFFKTCTGAQAKAWLENYQPKLDEMKKHKDDKVRSVATDFEEDARAIMKQEGVS